MPMIYAADVVDSGVVVLEESDARLLD